MKRPVLALVLFALAASAASARVRVVRHPAVSCAFSLLATWGDAQVPAAGVTHATVLVYGQTPACSQWNAYSDVDWVTVEAAPADAQPAAYVSVAANPTSLPRTTTLIIAGRPLVLTQQAGAAIAPDTSVVVNGSFDRDLASWTWYSRFPNGIGTAQWSPLDANGNPASGSMVLNDNDYNTMYGFQRLQCVPVKKDWLYTFGAKVRTAAGVERGDVVIAFLSYPNTTCADPYTKRDEHVINPDQPGVWQSFSFATRTASRTESVLIVLDSHGKLPPFESWFDDVFVRPE